MATLVDVYRVHWSIFDPLLISIIFPFDYVDEKKILMILPKFLSTAV